jgi:membrane-associated phospholipid phosphatase
MIGAAVSLKTSNCRYLVLSSTALCILGLLTACGTLKNGHAWGQDATLFPGWHRVSNAAIDAVVAPETWVPVAGAAVLQVDHMDKRISHYATSHTPVFGSQDAAGYAGHLFRESSKWAYLVTSLTTPGGDTPDSWAGNKLKGLAVGAAAFVSTSGATGFVKDTAKRTRPDRSDNKSFPSYTTAASSVSTTLASRNLDSLPLDDGSRTAFRIGLFSLTAATGWARVEAAGHYPADALVGAACGHFFGVFFNNAFLGLDNPHDVALEVEPSRSGVMVRFQWSF